jgi:hypothetical protein
MSSDFSIGQSAACVRAQHLGGEVGGRHFHLPARFGREAREQRHGQRIRLLAGGARRAPRAHAPRLPRVGPCLERREHTLVQELELPAVAEELRLVRGDTVEHLSALVGCGRVADDGVVALERRQAKLAQPSGQAPH